MKKTKVRWQSKEFDIELADSNLKEVRVMAPGGTDPEVYYYDCSHGALFPIGDGTISGDDKHAAIAAAVRSLLEEK